MKLWLCCLPPKRYLPIRKMNTLQEEIDVLKKVENDGKCTFCNDCVNTIIINVLEFLSLFLQPSVKSELLKSLTIAEQVKKLGEGIEIISRELQKQVLNKHNDLIKQATHANRLESILNTMNVHMQNLFANAERLKTQVH